MSIDAVLNLAKVTVSIGYDSAAVSIVLTAGGGSKVPPVSVNGTWWNSTDYGDPSDDPNVELVRVTNVAVDTLTITRAQEGTAASNHNTVGKTYKILFALTKLTMDKLAVAVADGTANEIYATASSGGSATPAFRALVTADIPSLSGTYLPLTGGTISGTLGVTGHVTLESVTSTGATGTGELVFSANPIFTVGITSPTFNYTDTGAAQTDKLHVGGTGSAGNANGSNFQILRNYDNVVLLNLTGLGACTIGNSLLAGGDFKLYQNGIASITSINASAVANTLYVAGGKVGINTSSVGAALTVVGGINNGIQVNDSTSPTVYGGMFTTSSTLFVLAQSNHILQLGANNTAWFNLSTTGAIRASAYGAGTITSDGSGNWTSVSDERLKDIKEPFVLGLDVIKFLNPIRFSWTTESGLNTSDDNIGFSSQEVQKILPQAVSQQYQPASVLKSVDLASAVIVQHQTLKQLPSVVEGGIPSLKQISTDLTPVLSFADRPVIAALVNAVKELLARIEILEAVK